MLKCILTLFLFITVTISVKGQTDKIECKKFRKGTFSYKEEPFTSVIVERTQKTQKEHETKSGLQIDYKIKWTGDCEYELIQTWSNDTEINKGNGKVLKVKMTNVFVDSYEYICDDSGRITQYTVVRIKK